MGLPLNLPLSLMQTQWKAQLDPIIADPLSGANLITAISLINGATVINHMLGRTPIGWFLTDIQGAATVYRSQPFNSLTLTLTSSAAVTVNLAVF